MKDVILCRQLERSFLSYKKQNGVLNSIKGFFQRQHIEKKALLPLNLKVEEGIIVGLVGANGAGKTTLLKLLSGLIHPTGGSVEVLGYRPYERAPEFLRQISILLGQKNQLWWDITPLDSYNLLAAIYGLDEKWANQRVHLLSEMLGCTQQLNIQLRRLSLGERMKMEIIGSLLHKPRILFLDEPTIGLDVLAQNTIRHFLENYVKEEKPTIILTSHYMDDISKLANRLLLMKQGEVKYDGTVAEFMSSSSQLQRLICTLRKPLAASQTLSNGLHLAAGQEVIQAELPPNMVSEFLAEVMQNGAGIDQIRVEEADFEEVIRRFLEKDASLR
jgi:ABC-2 type transport system ATP-binding protein